MASVERSAAHPYPPLAKWRLMLKSLPIVAAVLTTKLVLHHTVGFRGVIDFTDVGLVLTAGVFLVGLMLAGTMSDYKESEKLPADLACTLASLEVVYRQAAVANAKLDGTTMRASLVDCARVVLGWLEHKRSRHELDAALNSIASLACTFERSGLSAYATRTANDLNLLRRALSRIDVISRTGFLSVGYALLDSVVVIIVGLLLVCRFKGTYDEILLVSFVTLIYVYSVRLIRDVDNPFDYENGVAHGSTEIELFPIIEFLAPLEQALGREAAESEVRSDGSDVADPVSRRRGVASGNAL